MKSTVTGELHACLKDEVQSSRTTCRKAEMFLESVAPQQLNINLDGVVPSIDKALGEIKDANIPQLLNTTTQKFADMQGKIQTEIDKKLHSSQDMLKKIADELFVVAETISTQIRQINFDSLYDICYSNI
ncbi:hypothetical protein COOONC_00844 [Cooperia oncophora]